MRDLLTLTQWLSPSFPVGAFAFSHGVETAVQDGRVPDAHALEVWLRDILIYGSGQSDIVLLSAAYRARDVLEVEKTAIAFQASLERLEETRQLGAAFCRTVREVWSLELTNLVYPVAVGRAAALRSLPLADTAALYAHAFVANLVAAAIRLVPLGQTEGQAVLARLQPDCEELGQEAVHMSLDDLASAAFVSDILSMRHETLSPRIFQS